VRGNIPTPGADTVRYGGNTACVEVLVGGQRLIFDGGTGLRVLGCHLMNQEQPVSAHLFFTHTHWDRIRVFRFLRPLLPQLPNSISTGLPPSMEHLSSSA
jgi:ribonuclease Z